MSILRLPTNPAPPAPPRVVDPAGVYADLARLDRDALLDATALARALGGVSARTLQRRVSRGQLPRPMAGGLWFAGQVLDHLASAADRLVREDAAAETARKRVPRRRGES